MHTKSITFSKETVSGRRNRPARKKSAVKLVRLCAAVFALALGAPTSAHAIEMGLLLTAPALINEILLLVSLVALFVALKVYQLVKGGLLAKSWQFFFIGLFCLTLAQFITVSGNAGFFVVPKLAQPVLLLAMGGSWLYGALKAKQALG